jgi:hypothetical protein
VTAITERAIRIRLIAPFSWGRHFSWERVNGIELSKIADNDALKLECDCRDHEDSSRRKAWFSCGAYDNCANMALQCGWMMFSCAGAISRFGQCNRLLERYQSWA